MRHIMYVINVGAIVLSMSAYSAIIWDRSNNTWWYQRESSAHVAHDASVALCSSRVGRVTGIGNTRIGRYNPKKKAYDTYVQTAFRDGDMCVDHARVETISGVGDTVVKNGSYVNNYVRTGSVSLYDACVGSLTLTGNCYAHNARIHNIPRMVGALSCDSCWGGDTYRVYGSADLVHAHIKNLVINQRRPDQLILPKLLDGMSLSDVDALSDEDEAAFVQNTTPRMQHMMLGALHMDYIKQRQMYSDENQYLAEVPMAFVLSMDSCCISSVDIYDDGASRPYVYVISHYNPVYVSCHNHTGCIVTNTPDKIIPYNTYIVPFM